MTEIRISKSYNVFWLYELDRELDDMGFNVDHPSEYPNRREDIEYDFRSTVYGGYYSFYVNNDKLESYIRLRFADLIIEECEEWTVSN